MVSTKDIINSININDDNRFLDLISSLSLNDLNSIDFEEIDKEIMKSTLFPVKTKLVYAKYYSRPIYRKLLEKITENMYASDFEALLFVARAEEYFRKEILDILVIRTFDQYKKEMFTIGLKSSNLYDEYVDGLKNGKDSIAKVKFALTFDCLNDFYPDNMMLARLIANSDIFKGLYSSRSEYLVELAKVTKDKETLQYIEMIMEEVVRRESNEFYTESYKGLGIKEDPKEKIEKSVKLKLPFCIKKIKDINNN